jgi:hypothetical protein
MELLAQRTNFIISVQFVLKQLNRERAILPVLQDVKNKVNVLVLLTYLLTYLRS